MAISPHALGLEKTGGAGNLGQYQLNTHQGLVGQHNSSESHVYTSAAYYRDSQRTKQVPKEEYLRASSSATISGAAINNPIPMVMRAFRTCRCMAASALIIFAAAATLFTEPEVRRAIPVERKAPTPKSTPVRRAIPVATPAAVTATTPTDSNESKFASIPLLKELTIEVPSSWWILGTDLDAIIKTTAEATRKLANLPAPEGKRTTLFRANSMPRTTYASIAVSVVDPPDITLEEYNAAGESDLRELAQHIAASTEQGGITIVTPPTAKKETINGIPALVSSYTKQGKKGVTRVETIFLFEAGKQFSITLAYREAEGDIWKPIIEYHAAINPAQRNASREQAGRKHNARPRH